LTVQRTISEFRALGNLEGALVPTLGALHEGHVSLIRAAHDTGRPVAVSVFVNPTQFGPNEDYTRYPRSFEEDRDLAEKAGADVLFHPEPSEMYPRETCQIHVPEVTDQFEGALRPGHFNGVATVVCKLFQIVRPRFAFFGLKDLQQCAVIRRMVEDLNVPVELRFEPTIREPDGLAMSSRNRFLTESERSIAPLLFGQLTEARAKLLRNEPPDEVLRASLNVLSHAGFQTQYFDLVDTTSFTPTRWIGHSSALVAATLLGKTRLIDNVLLFDPSNMP
jgi:pantoate--beta-alanine ligase